MNSFKKALIALEMSSISKKNFSLYRKNPKNLYTQTICCHHPKIWISCLYHSEIGPKDVDRIANSVDPDQIAPRLFAQTCLSENLGSLR